MTGLQYAARGAYAERPTEQILIAIREIIRIKTQYLWLLRIGTVEMRYNMTNEEAVKWLDSLYQTIGQTAYGNLWNYAQPITEIIELLESQRWIPVTERLPKRDDRVLVYIPEIGGSNCSIQISKGWSMKYVSHWMPLPLPPKEEST